MTYYIKGGSRYNEANPKVWVALMLGGFQDIDYLDSDWKDIDYDLGVPTGVAITAQDPFWRMGGSSGGAKETEIGLWEDYRIRFTTTGISYYDGAWKDLLAEGGASSLNELSDVVIDGTPADNELLAYDTTTSKWINQTGTQSGLSLSGHTHAQLHDRSHTYDSTSDHSGTLSWANVNKTGSNLTDLATRQHAGLTDVTSDLHHAQVHALNTHTQGSNVIFMAKGTAFTEIGLGTAGYVLVSGGDGADLIWESHYTQAEVNGLLHPQAHTLASHSSEAHNELTGYNDETDVKHLTDAQLGDLHEIYTLEAHALATTGPHTGTLPWTDLNKTGSSLADLITRAHSNLSDAPTSAHHVRYADSEAVTALATADVYLKLLGDSMDGPINMSGEEINSISDIKLLGADGNGLRFWNSLDYSIYMSEVVDVNYGGSVDGTSDFNMYFNMTNGTNRGFQFCDGLLNPYFAITPDTGLWSDVPLDMGSNKITSLTDGSAAQDAMAFGQKYTLENHILSPASGPHTGTLLWSELNKTGSSLADLATRLHSNLSDAPTSAHHVKTVKYTAGEVDARIVVQNTHPAGTTDIAMDTLISNHKDLPNDHHVPTVKYTAGEVDARIVIQNTHPAGTIDMAVDALILNHKNLPNDHHTPTVLYTDADAVQAVEDTGLVMAKDTGISFEAVMFDQMYSGICIDIDTTGCALYDLVYCDNADSVLPANANSTNTMPAIGIVVETNKVMVCGTVHDDPLLVPTTPGAVIYVDTTNGKMTQTPPSGEGDIVQAVGICIGNHIEYVNLNDAFYEHDNAFHSTNYHTESDGTGVVTVHSDITSAGSGIIITAGERADLHSDVVTTNAHVQALSINAVSEDSSPSLGGNLTLAGGSRIIGPSVSDYYIWSISSTYLTHGLYYNTGTPDYLEIKWGGSVSTRFDMEKGDMYLYDATFADYVRMYHSGTHGYITTGGTGGGDLYLEPAGNIRSSKKIYNTVYNDYADYWKRAPNTEKIPGMCYSLIKGKGIALTNKRADKACMGICSDTYGHAVGNTKNAIPLSVGGFILAYLDKEYDTGDLLVPNDKGILTLATKDEIIMQRCVAKYMYKEEKIMTKGVKVNGRHWVKVL